MVWTYQPSFIEIAIVLTEHWTEQRDRGTDKHIDGNTDNKGRKKKTSKNYFLRFFFRLDQLPNKKPRRRLLPLVGQVYVIMPMMEKYQQVGTDEKYAPISISLCIAIENDFTDKCLGL